MYDLSKSQVISHLSRHKGPIVEGDCAGIQSHKGRNVCNSFPRYTCTISSKEDFLTPEEL